MLQSLEKCLLEKVIVIGPDPVLDVLDSQPREKSSELIQILQGIYHLFEDSDNLGARHRFAEFKVEQLLSVRGLLEKVVENDIRYFFGPNLFNPRPTCLQCHDLGSRQP